MSFGVTKRLIEIEMDGFIELNEMWSINCRIAFVLWWYCCHHKRTQRTRSHCWFSHYSSFFPSMVQFKNSPRQIVTAQCIDVSECRLYNEWRWLGWIIQSIHWKCWKRVFKPNKAQLHHIYCSWKEAANRSHAVARFARLTTYHLLAHCFAVVAVVAHKVHY